MAVEAWLRGPIAGIDPLLMPAAHAMVQAGEDVEAAVADLSPAQLWVKPGGAASVAFHLRHIAGSVDRLLTYGRGRQLDDRQREALSAERSMQDPLPELSSLVANVKAAVELALRTFRECDPASLTTPRMVGREALPSTVLGVYFHVAEHTQRHVGQLVTTAKIVRGLGLERAPQ